MISMRDDRRIRRIVARGTGFSLTAFKKGRRRKRRAGVVLFWGGLGMLVLDMTTTFPTPVLGQYAAWWLLVVAAGAGLWLSAKRLPLEETIEVAKYCRGELTVTDLTSELNVTIGTAERILQALARKGYAKLEQRGESRVWVLPEVKASLAARLGRQP
jgi:hypothetical protein